MQFTKIRVNLNLFLNFSVYLCLNIHLSIYFSIYLKNLCYSLSLVVQLWSCVRLFVTHGLQHARLPCPSVSPGICLPLSWWCHLILCCPLLLLPSVLPSIRVFSSESAVRIRWPKYCSFSFSICPSSEYSGLISFRIGLISLQSKGLSRVFSNTTVQKHQFFGIQPSLWSSFYIHTWLLGKTIPWLYGPLSAKYCLYFLICCLGL